MEFTFKFFVTHTVETWYVIGAVFMALEMLLGMTIVMFYAGLACFALAILINFNFIPKEDISSQIAIYFALFIFFAIALWKPLQYLSLKNRKSKDKYTNIIGAKAVVYGKDLHKDKIGKIKWSGTICRAIIGGGSDEVIIQDSVVKILEVKDNIFVVKSLNEKSS